MEEGELGHLDQLQDHVELCEAQVCGNGDSVCVWVCVYIILYMNVYFRMVDILR